VRPISKLAGERLATYTSMGMSAAAPRQAASPAQRASANLRSEASMARPRESLPTELASMFTPPPSTRYSRFGTDSSSATKRIKRTCGALRNPTKKVSLPGTLPSRFFSRSCSGSGKLAIATGRDGMRSEARAKRSLGPLPLQSLTNSDAVPLVWLLTTTVVPSSLASSAKGSVCSSRSRAFSAEASSPARC
jgi:hypothetical protein